MVSDLITYTFLPCCRRSSPWTWSLLFPGLLSKPLCLRCLPPKSRRFYPGPRLSVLMRISGKIRGMRRTYKTILNVELIVGALDCAAIIYGDHLGGCLPVAVVLLIGEHVGLHKNYVSPKSVKQSGQQPTIVIKQILERERDRVHKLTSSMTSYIYFAFPSSHPWGCLSAGSEALVRQAATARITSPFWFNYFQIVYFKPIFFTI